MAFAATHTARAPLAGRILSALGDAFMAYAEARSHAAEIAALEAKTDAQLAEMGLTRDTIVRHVFSDKFYL